MSSLLDDYDFDPEDEVKLEDLDPEELITIAEEEVTPSDHIEDLRIALQEQKVIDAQNQEHIDKDEAIPQELQERSSNIVDRIDDLTEILIDDIKNW